MLMKLTTLCPQEPATCSYSEPHPLNPCLPPSYFFMIHFVLSFHLRLVAYLHDGKKHDRLGDFSLRDRFGET